MWLPLSLLLLPACRHGAQGDLADVDIHLSEAIPTVIVASWSLDGADAWMEWSADGERWTRVEATEQADGSWEALAFGLHTRTAYDVRVGGTVDGEPVVSDPVEVTTGSGPEDEPDIVVTADEPGLDGGFVGVGLISSTSKAGFLDSEGALVWWFAPDIGDQMVTRVLRSVDGRSVLFNAVYQIGTGEPADNLIYRVSYDGSEVERIPTPYAHHDFCELPDGTLAWLAQETRTYESVPMEGDTVVERAPDGTEREVWNAWDWYDPADYVDAIQGTTFVHANTIKVDASSETYWVGLRNANEIIRIDRASGDVLEHLLGRDTDVPLVGTDVGWQHSFSLLDDGFVVHDNRTATDEDSRIVRYVLDRDADTLTEAWDFTGPYHVTGLGDAVPLAGGDTLAVWSTAGEIAQVTEAGEVPWKVNLGVGTVFGYGTWSEGVQVTP